MHNRDAGSMERVLDILYKEKPECVFIYGRQPQTETDAFEYFDAEEIDNFMYNRFKGKTNFKVGHGERMVYEKVTGLKRAAVNQSILYNFSSEGAFVKNGVPVGLY